MSLDSILYSGPVPLSYQNLPMYFEVFLDEIWDEMVFDFRFSQCYSASILSPIHFYGIRPENFDIIGS
jgi:hypothetical protein